MSSGRFQGRGFDIPSSGSPIGTTPVLSDNDEKSPQIDRRLLQEHGTSSTPILNDTPGSYNDLFSRFDFVNLPSQSNNGHNINNTSNIFTNLSSPSSDFTVPCAYTSIDTPQSISKNSAFNSTSTTAFPFPPSRALSHHLPSYNRLDSSKNTPLLNSSTSNHHYSSSNQQPITNNSNQNPLVTPLVTPSGHTNTNDTNNNDDLDHHSIQISPSTTIPIDLLRHIFSYMSLPDILHLSSVSRSFREAINNPLLWRILDLSSLSHIMTDDTFIHFISHQRFSYVQCLNLSGCTSLTSYALSYIPKLLPYLHTLDLSICINVTPEVIVQLGIMPGLKRFEFSHALTPDLTIQCIESILRYRRILYSPDYEQRIYKKNNNRNVGNRNGTTDANNHNNFIIYDNNNTININNTIHTINSSSNNNTGINDHDTLLSPIATHPQTTATSPLSLSYNHDQQYNTNPTSPHLKKRIDSDDDVDSTMYGYDNTHRHHHRIPYSDIRLSNGYLYTSHLPRQDRMVIHQLSHMTIYQRRVGNNNTIYYVVSPHTFITSYKKILIQLYLQQLYRKSIAYHNDHTNNNNSLFSTTSSSLHSQPKLVSSPGRHNTNISIQQTPTIDQELFFSTIAQEYTVWKPPVVPCDGIDMGKTWLLYCALRGVNPANMINTNDMYYTSDRYSLILEQANQQQQNNNDNNRNQPANAAAPNGGGDDDDDGIVFLQNNDGAGAGGAFNLGDDVQNNDNTEAAMLAKHGPIPRWINPIPMHCDASRLGACFGRPRYAVVYTYDSNMNNSVTNMPNNTANNNGNIQQQRQAPSLLAPYGEWFYLTPPQPSHGYLTSQNTIIQHKRPSQSSSGSTSSTTSRSSTAGQSGNTTTTPTPLPRQQSHQQYRDIVIHKHRVLYPYSPLRMYIFSLFGECAAHTGTIQATMGYQRCMNCSYTFLSRDTDGTFCIGCSMVRLRYTNLYSTRMNSNIPPVTDIHPMLLRHMTLVGVINTKIDLSSLVRVLQRTTNNNNNNNGNGNNDNTNNVLAMIQNMITGINGNNNNNTNTIGETLPFLLDGNNNMNNQNNNAINSDDYDPSALDQVGFDPIHNKYDQQQQPQSNNSAIEMTDYTNKDGSNDTLLDRTDQDSSSGSSSTADRRNTTLPTTTTATPATNANNNENISYQVSASLASLLAVTQENIHREAIRQCLIKASEAGYERGIVTTQCARPISRHIHSLCRELKLEHDMTHQGRPHNRVERRRLRRQRRQQRLRQRQLGQVQGVQQPENNNAEDEDDDDDDNNNNANISNTIHSECFCNDPEIPAYIESGFRSMDDEGLIEYNANKTNTNIAHPHRNDVANNDNQQNGTGQENDDDDGKLYIYADCVGLSTVEEARYMHKATYVLKNSPYISLFSFLFVCIMAPIFYSYTQSLINLNDEQYDKVLVTASPTLYITDTPEIDVLTIVLAVGISFLILLFLVVMAFCTRNGPMNLIRLYHYIMPLQILVIIFFSNLSVGFVVLDGLGINVDIITGLYCLVMISAFEILALYNNDLFSSGDNNNNNNPIQPQQQLRQRQRPRNDGQDDVERRNDDNDANNNRDDNDINNRNNNNGQQQWRQQRGNNTNQDDGDDDNDNDINPQQLRDNNNNNNDNDNEHINDNDMLVWQPRNLKTKTSYIPRQITMILLFITIPTSFAAMLPMEFLLVILSIVAFIDFLDSLSTGQNTSSHQLIQADSGNEPMNLQGLIRIPNFSFPLNTLLCIRVGEHFGLTLLATMGYKASLFTCIYCIIYITSIVAWSIYIGPYIGIHTRPYVLCTVLCGIVIIVGYVNDNDLGGGFEAFSALMSSQYTAVPYPA